MHEQAASKREKKNLLARVQTFSGMARKRSINSSSRRTSTGSGPSEEEIGVASLPQADDDLAPSTARPVSRFARVLSLKPRE
jgi:hypothetical protein